MMKVISETSCSHYIWYLCLLSLDPYLYMWTISSRGIIHPPIVWL